MWITPSNGHSLIGVPGRQTSSVIRHLSKKHRIRVYDDEDDLEGENEELPLLVKSLVNTFSVQRFRMLLARWIVLMHLAFSVVENDNFHSLLDCICPSVKQYLVSSGNTIRTWILRDFQRCKEQVKRNLKVSLSRIRISFDIWTSGPLDLWPSAFISWSCCTLPRTKSSKSEFSDCSA